MRGIERFPWQTPAGAEIWRKAALLAEDTARPLSHAGCHAHTQWPSGCLGAEHYSTQTGCKTRPGRPQQHSGARVAGQPGEHLQGLCPGSCASGARAWAAEVSVGLVSSEVRQCSLDTSPVPELARARGRPALAVPSLQVCSPPSTYNPGAGSLLDPCPLGAVRGFPKLELHWTPQTRAMHSALAGPAVLLDWPQDIEHLFA